MTDTFESIYRRSIDDPESFWGEAAESVHWYRKWNQVLDAQDAPFYRWFAGGQTNVCYNAVDRHVESGHGSQVAVIYDSAMTRSQQKITFHELQERVAAFAGALRGNGVGSGDRVIVYMPMIPEAVVAMLACARIGAVHSVVFGGFAAHELAVRINDCEPKVIVAALLWIGTRPGSSNTSPCSIRRSSWREYKPARCIIFQRPQALAAMDAGRDLDWAEAVVQSTPVDCIPMDALEPLYILYTSGTTGQPKGVVRDTGSSMVALHWSMKNIYDVVPGEVFWAASDVGWVVGHSYIVYGPLLGRNTTVMFEGKPVGTPDPGVFWRVIEEHGVKVLFTAPTAFRAIKKEDPQGTYLKQYDTSGLRSLFLAGERTDPDTLNWAADKLQVPVIDHWWQTETGWSICANCLGIETAARQARFGDPAGTRLEDGGAGR